MRHTKYTKNKKTLITHPENSVTRGEKEKGVWNVRRWKTNFLENNLQREEKVKAEWLAASIPFLKPLFRLPIASLLSYIETQPNNLRSSNIPLFIGFQHKLWAINNDTSTLLFFFSFKVYKIHFKLSVDRK